MPIELIYGTLDDFLAKYPGMDEMLKLAVDNKNDALAKNITNFYFMWQTFNMRYAVLEQDWAKINEQIS